MAIEVLSWIVAIPLLGWATGLRTMTPMAALSWFAYLGYLPVGGTWAFWLARPVTVGVFTLLALGELVGDKLPFTPNRTAMGPLAARLVFGGLAGAIVATVLRGPGMEGVVLGLVGAAVGAFAGFVTRRDLVQKVGCRDWHIAVVEDLFAIGCALFALHVIVS